MYDPNDFWTQVLSDWLEINYHEPQNKASVLAQIL